MRTFCESINIKSIKSGLLDLDIVHLLFNKTYQWNSLGPATMNGSAHYLIM